MYLGKLFYRTSTLLVKVDPRSTLYLKLISHHIIAHITLAYPLAIVQLIPGNSPNHHR